MTPNRTSALASRFVTQASGERIEVHGGWLSFLAVGEQTGGAYALIETMNDPSTGVLLHIHEREDETWFILEGEYTFQVGDQTFLARPGDYVFGARNVSHSYANRTSAVARSLIMVSPAGFEGFWSESARLRGDASAAARDALGQKYGVRSVTDLGKGK